jgi:hypothetical protein
LATTDPALAPLVLQGLSEAGVEFAILHDADKLLSGGAISDVDIVVAHPPARLVAAASSTFSKLGLHPIVVWPYDPGGSVTTFLVTGNAQSGIQVDMLYDPSGSGRYRVRSPSLLAGAQAGDGLREVRRVDQIVYLWIKRSAKQQAERLRDLAEAAATLDRRELVDASISLTGDEHVASAILEGRPHPPDPSPVALRLARVVRRIARPVGFWAHWPAANRASAEEVSRRFASVLVRGASGVHPGPAAAPVWFAQDVAKVRYRPGLYVSYGAAGRSLVKPDLVVADGAIDDAAAAIVTAMTQRNT